MMDDYPRTSRLTAAWPWISTAARLGLAAVFLVAGALKVGDLAASGRAVNAYHLMSFDAARVVGGAQPFVEMALGVLLLVGVATRLTAAIAALLLVIFIAGIVSAWGRGLQIDCGCFSKGGDLAAGRTAEYGSEILRDVGFLALAAILLVKPRTKYSVDSILLGEA
jgi:uncharacterized membrane protein YphA (DoxX/SURF4 family)